MIFPSRSQLASKQITRTGRAEAVPKEGLAATLLPGRQPDQMGQRHSLRPVRPRSCPGPLRNGSLCCISTRMWALPLLERPLWLAPRGGKGKREERRGAAERRCWNGSATDGRAWDHGLDPRVRRGQEAPWRLPFPTPRDPDQPHPCPGGKQGADPGHRAARDRTRDRGTRGGPWTAVEGNGTANRSNAKGEGLREPSELRQGYCLYHLEDALCDFIRDSAQELFTYGRSAYEIVCDTDVAGARDGFKFVSIHPKRKRGGGGNARGVA